MAGTSRSRARLFISLVLGAAYILVLGELFVRLFAPIAIMPRYVAATPYGVRGNAPSSHYWHFTPEVTVEYSINASGFRADREYPLARPDGICRIILYGDSYFMGYEAALSDSFAAQLETGLNDDGYPCEVINMAVSGLGHAEMLVALTENGLRYAPDAVIFSWHRTDVNDNVRADLFRYQNGSLTRHAESYLPAVAVREKLAKFPVYLWAAQYSQLYSAIRERGGRMAKNALVAIKSAESTPSSTSENPEPVAAAAPVGRALRLTSEILTAAADISNAAGAEFFLFEIPNRTDRTVFRPVDQRLEELLPPEISFVSPLEPLLEAAAPDTLIYYEEGAGHWTPLGNKIAARVALDALLRSGVLERFKSPQ